jgi:hypothetical protein
MDRNETQPAAHAKSKSPKTRERQRSDRTSQLRAELDSWLVTYNIRRRNHSDYVRRRTPRQVLDTHHEAQGSMTTADNCHLDPCGR